MEVQVLANHEAVSRRAVELVVEWVRDHPGPLIAAGPGQTLERPYALLADAMADRPGLLSEARLVKLCEWVGLAGHQRASVEWYIQHHVVQPLGVPHSRYMGFDGMSQKLRGECRRVQKWLKANGRVDLCILGMGINGTVGFNEPGTHTEPDPHVETLSSQSLALPAIQALDDPPRKGMTLGMNDLVQARRMLLIVTGEQKRLALSRLLDRNITPQFPASYLWKGYDVTCLCDRAARGY